MLIDDLQEVRNLRIQIKQLLEERERLEPSLASPRMDGMPRGGKGEGIEAQIDLRTEMNKRIKETAKAALLAEQKVREQMVRLPCHLYSVCLYYYINAMSAEDTTEVMHIARSTLYEWIDKLKVWTQSDSTGLDRTRNDVV